MNENKPTADDHVHRRRCVLRGALSAPVVLAVSSGASATMASNMRCVVNQVTNPQYGIRSTGVSTEVTSTTVRIPLYRDSDGKRYIRGSDILALAHASRPVTWIKSGQWWEFKVNSNQRVGSALTLSTTPSLTSPVQYAVLQMDQHGQIVSVGAHTRSTAMVHGTCWNSFRSGALPPL